MSTTTRQQEPAGQLRGELGERLDRAALHLRTLNADEMRREMVSPDAEWHWGADYMGRWVGVTALLERRTGRTFGTAAVARELIGYQQANGSFGPYSEPHDYKEWFGMGRALVGLLEYHEAVGDTEALASARRLAAYYASHYPGAPEFMSECYASALEGLVALARITKDPDDLELARTVALSSTVFRRTWMSPTVSEAKRRAPCGGQVHCQLSIARGLLDLQGLTGESQFLDAALALHAHIVHESLWVSGGVGFYFNCPEQNETCSDADWIRLNLQLWRTTASSRYLDYAENALFNQLLFDQVDSGAFTYLRTLQGEPGASFDACCSHHGPRALLEIPDHAFAVDGDGVHLNLLVEATARLATQRGSMDLETEIRDDGDLELSVAVSAAPDQPLALRIRVPSWAGEALTSVNSKRVPGTELDGSDLVLDRRWHSGDVVQVCFPQRIGVVKGERLGSHLLRDDVVALVRGRRLYCLSDVVNPHVVLPLVRLASITSGADVAVGSPGHIEVAGTTADGRHVTLVLTRLADLGGKAMGSGRNHPVSMAPYRVWLPQDSGEKAMPLTDGGSKGESSSGAISWL